MIRHVLLDADGVLQRHPLGWAEAAEKYVGDRGSEFFAAVSEVERTCLRGDDEFFPLLATELDRFAVTAPADEVYTGVWLTIESVPATVELVVLDWLRSLLGRPLAIVAEADGTGHAETFARVAAPPGTPRGAIVIVTPARIEEGLLL